MHSDPTSAAPLARAFERLQAALTPFVQDAMQAAFGEQWQHRAEEGLRESYVPHQAWDTHALLLIMHNNWHTAFQSRLGDSGRLLVSELRTLRQQDAPALNPADAYRVLDTAARLLQAVGDEAGAQAVQQDALALMQQQFPYPAPPPAPATVASDATVELPRAADLLGPDDPPTPPAPDPEPNNQPEPDDQAEPETLEPETANPQSETSEADLAVQHEVAEPTDEEAASDTPSGLRRWFGRFLGKAEEHDLEPLELRTRLLDTLEHALKRFRATRPLPFNRITIHILAPTSGDRLTYEAALNDLTPPFDQAARHRLYESGFDLPDLLHIRTKIYAQAPSRLEAAFAEAGSIYVELKQHTTRTTATLTVVKGAAEKKSYRIRSTERINIGRLHEVVEDRYGHIVRRNDVAFIDHHAPNVGEGNAPINETISRRHARIEFDDRLDAFTLINEQGVTSVSRLGLPHPVRVGHQAVPLQDGDLIYLGQACLRFETKRRG